MSRGTNTNEHSLSGLRAWAISLGCAVGWGAFVMPGTLFLPTGGTLGSLVALCAGGAAMAVIALCISYLRGKEPNARGISGLVELVLGSDHAFLCSWTMVFAYAAIIWANCTSVVLLFRFLVGPMLQVGYLYQIGGYSVYIGEIVVTLLVICTAGLLSLFTEPLCKRCMYRHGNRARWRCGFDGIICIRNTPQSHRNLFTGISTRLECHARHITHLCPRTLGVRGL